MWARWSLSSGSPYVAECACDHGPGPALGSGLAMHALTGPWDDVRQDGRTSR